MPWHCAPLLFLLLALFAGPSSAQMVCMSRPNETGLDMKLSQDRRTMEFRFKHSGSMNVACLLELDCTVREDAKSVQYRAVSQRPGWEGVVNDIKQFTFKLADGGEQVCAVARVTQLQPKPLLLN